MLRTLFNFANWFPRRTRPEPLPADLDEDCRRIIAAVRPYTMTSIERLVALIDATRHISTAGIPGDVVECGVWRGGSSMAAALTLLAASDTHRALYLYDTFEGMSAPSGMDRDHSGVSAATQLDRIPRGQGVWCEASEADVRQNMTSTGYPAERVRYIRGPVEDTIPGVIPERIALLRIDTDWYESTRHELRHLFPRLSPGGILIIDDYGHWKGARKAVDEYLADHPGYFLHRIDYTGRLLIKHG
jgi:hypothetical protein